MFDMHSTIARDPRIDATDIAEYLSRGDRPSWLPQPDGARWARCVTFIHIAANDGDDRVLDGLSAYDEMRVLDFTRERPPGVMPHLLRTAPAQRRGPGRPPREKAEAALCAYAAWAADIAGAEMATLASLVYGEDRPGASSRVPRRVERLVESGRRLYAAAGVLPWVAYARGRAPARWKGDSAFVGAVRRWQGEAALQPARESQPGELGEPLPPRLRSALRADAVSPLAVLWRNAEDGVLGRLCAVEPWSPRTDASAPPSAPAKPAPRRREPPPVRAPAPVIVRFKCPLCGGPHLRADHPGASDS